MTTEILFQIHLVLGYVAWLLCFGTYVLPWLRSMDRIVAQSTIATLHSFRFFGLKRLQLAQLRADGGQVFSRQIPRFRARALAVLNERDERANLFDREAEVAAASDEGQPL